MVKLSPAPDMFSGERWPLISVVAMALGASEWNVRKWRTRRKIPGSWHLPLLDACSKRRVALSTDELLSTQSQRAA